MYWNLSEDNYFLLSSTIVCRNSGYVSVIVSSIYTMNRILLSISLSLPAGKIVEKAMWRSVFLTIWHRILNADSTKTPSSSVTF